MKLPDIFEEFDAHFNKIFDEWNKFDEEFERMIEESKNNENTYQFTSHYENFYDSSDENKSYSLTYKYETGMDEPEITIEGNVDDETINNFVKNIENRFGRSFKTLPTNRIKRLIAGKSKKKDSKKEKQEIPSEKSYTFEMPGIGKNDVETKINDKILTITGKKNKLFYEKRVHLPFEPKKKVDVKADNGLITVTVYRK
ncbi:MAG: Hsp20/alpha crystallin family protein [Candidatus Lokiarchaeota archaeon]|nr:Hsp20/alpha crystallin family protein [Candidatus Harpocratesius repetitus]